MNLKACRKEKGLRDTAEIGGKRRRWREEVDKGVPPTYLGS